MVEPGHSRCCDWGQQGGADLKAEIKCKSFHSGMHVLMRSMLMTHSLQGIGFEIARELSQEGVTTVVTARSEALGQEAKGKIEASEGVMVDLWCQPILPLMSIFAEGHSISHASIHSLDCLHLSLQVVPGRSFSTRWTSPTPPPSYDLPSGQNLNSPRVLRS